MGYLLLLLVGRRQDELLCAGARGPVPGQPGFGFARRLRPPRARGCPCPPPGITATTASLQKACEGRQGSSRCSGLTALCAPGWHPCHHHHLGDPGATSPAACYDPTSTTFTTAGPKKQMEGRQRPSPCSGLSALCAPGWHPCDPPMSEARGSPYLGVPEEGRQGSNQCCGLSALCASGRHPCLPPIPEAQGWPAPCS